MKIYPVDGIQNAYRLCVLESSLWYPTDGGGAGGIILFGRAGCSTGWMMTMLCLCWPRCLLTITAAGGGRFLWTSLAVISGHDIINSKSRVLYSV